MTTTAAFIPFLTAKEGFSSTWYWDVKGYSIGYGFFEATLDRVVGLNRTNLQHLTRSRADSIYRDLMAREFEPCLRRHLRVDVHPLMFEALLSWTYNGGCGWPASSALMRHVNARRFAEAANEFVKWNKVRSASGGLVPNATLTARRAREAERFREGMRLMGAGDAAGVIVPLPSVVVDVPAEIDLGPDALVLPPAMGAYAAALPWWLWLLIPAGVALSRSLKT